MVVIRLARGGAKKRPFYHIVATDRRNARDGRYLERLGYFNPVARGQECRLDIKMDRVDHWVSVGANASIRVANLLKEYKRNGNTPVPAPVREAKHLAKAKAPVAAEVATDTADVAATDTSEQAAE